MPRLTASVAWAVVTVVALGMAMVLTWRSVAAPTDVAASPARSRSVAVVVAAHTLAVPIQLQPNDLKVERYPPRLVPAEAFHDIAALVGHRLDAPVSSNQPITARDLAPKLYSPIVQLLPRGTVAVSVSLSAAQAAGGWVSGGMQVWLYATQNGRVQLLSRSARILAVDGQVAPTPRLAPWTGTAVLTVAVPKTVAPAVIQANQTGGLALALTATATGAESAP